MPLPGRRGCLLKVSDEDPESSLLLDTLHLALEGILSDNTTKFELQGSIQVLGIMENFIAKDGDVFGCGFMESPNCVLLTRNGTPLGKMWIGSYFYCFVLIANFALHFVRYRFNGRPGAVLFPIHSQYSAICNQLWQNHIPMVFRWRITSWINENKTDIPTYMNKWIAFKLSTFNLDLFVL
jgi:hypothetical protein